MLRDERRRDRQITDVYALGTVINQKFCAFILTLNYQRYINKEVFNLTS